eukprot:Plantae.Rhodophyta-Purpureofilum_apyrenoidigerum.ctg23095.p1 GENE.Plantae.Rhodophyta-Purpureofilum_apyrenoidigerum.ctg23095~~Plantae.Rhodophyta-Purpureofilum_apyrenoidigerum.ctg23095.p1  ORF type:complete len:249 (-),score=48.85 Plantae.Rhodophyta-Purpureofilum_apyrenoidigerum.ctg23095:100-846(-)
MVRYEVRLVICLCVMVLLGIGRSQMVGSRPRPRTSDVKYITCATCQAAAHRLHQYIQMHQKNLRENDLLTLLESFCDPFQPQGEWIPYYEMEYDRENHRLALKEHDFPGVCNEDCATIAKACTEAIEDSIYEMAEFCITHREEPVDMIKYLMCEGLNKVCHENLPKPPEDWKGAGFHAQSDEGIQMDKLRRMTGQNVQVLGSDDFPSMMNEMKDIEDVDEGTDDLIGGTNVNAEEKPGAGDEIVHDSL